MHLINTLSILGEKEKTMSILILLSSAPHRVSRPLGPY